jgi:hypothetical protein
MAQCVTFHSGTVVALGWRAWWCEFSPIKNGQGWLVEVELSLRNSQVLGTLRPYEHVPILSPTSYEA